MLYKALDKFFLKHPHGNINIIVNMVRCFNADGDIVFTGDIDTFIATYE